MHPPFLKRQMHSGGGNGDSGQGEDVLVEVAEFVNKDGLKFLFFSCNCTRNRCYMVSDASASMGIKQL